MNMNLLFLIVVLSVIVSLIVVGWFRSWAIRNLLDIPNERSAHDIPTPKGGGIGITGTSALLLAPLFVFQSQWTLLIFLIGAVMIGVLGFIDDNSELSPKLRLLIQALLATLIVFTVGSVLRITIPPITVTLPLLIAIPVNIIWILAVTNIYNFMDGMDGFAGMQAIVGGVAWTLFFWTVQEMQLALLASVITASSVGFLYWNRPPAKIFMGDVGSTFLGFSFAVLPLLAYRQIEDSRLLLLGFLFIAPFLFDGTLTIIRRAINGENILKAHRSHLYQRLDIAGYSHQQIDLIYLPLMILSAVTGFALWNETVLFPILAVILVGCGIGLFVYVSNVEKKKSMMQ